MSTFQELLMKQKEDAGLSDIIEQAQKESRKGSASSSKDDRIWKPSVDDVGNGFAVIRFLPSSDSKIPWVKFFDHGFKGDGGWFINGCPTTIGEECPVDVAFA